MLEWLKQSGPDPEDPMRNPASASALLAELRQRDPVAALDEMSAWLRSLGEAQDVDERARNEVLGLIQEAGAAHVAPLLRQYLASATDKPVVREAKWKAVFDYATSLAGALCASAERLLGSAKADSPALGATAAVRALRACRLLAKACLIHYADVPSSLWRRAYGVHARADAAGCAGTAVHPYRSQRTPATATEELVRLLMLHVIAPETLASEQIEIADRVADQLGSEFTLRPRGLADGPFWFDCEGDRGPQRATTAPGTATARFFGPGTALDALARLRRQMSSAGGPEAELLGKDIPLHAQVAAVEHLLIYWGPNAPAAAPAHSPAKGELRLLHGFKRVCKEITDSDPTASASRGLALVSDEDVHLDSPEPWVIRDAGGSEIGAEMRQPGPSWVRSGMLVGFALAGRNEWWLGVIRRTHADPAHGPHVDIALISRKPVALSLRPRAAGTAGEADWDVSAGTFAFVDINAILLPEASEATGTPNLLLPPEGWKAGRVYEATLDKKLRTLRLVRVLQRGEDFVRAAYEWLPEAA